ncbi:hypothetical protein F5Y12DRAFT_607967 [Xylaria sp. FL1777]|nr:hypothetical protein F5Y12DRAFT_607967 [Xylaria sp. FL1777]
MPFSAKKPPVDDLRQSLKSLTINKAHARDHRVSKPRQPDRAKAKTHPFHLGVNRPRRELLQLEPEQQDRAIAIFNTLHLPILDHVLNLIDQSICDGGMQNSNLLRDRASLLIIQAVMLIHQHAKVIPVYSSNGLFRTSGNDTVDSYTTYEGFVSVAQARLMAEKAVGELTEIGGKLDKYVMHFI